MPLLADALQPQLVSGLASVRGESSKRTLADLITARGTAFDLNIDNAKQSFLLDFRDQEILSTAFAADAGRLSSASFQTVAHIIEDMLSRDRAAWGLVKLYYSAFYSGHALLRFFGEGCTYFGGQHVFRLRQLSVALQLAPLFSVEAGLYHCVLDTSGTKMVCCRARGSVGGAHEAFWKIFGVQLQSIAEKVLLSGMTLSDSQAVYAQIDRALATLSRSGGYSWLSSVRNDLQYRLQYGVWFPETRRAPTLQTLSRLSAQWKMDAMLIDFQRGQVAPLGDFVSCCAFVISLCREIVWRVAERSTVGARSFARVGPVAFLNDIGVTS